MEVEEEIRRLASSRDPIPNKDVGIFTLDRNNINNTSHQHQQQQSFMPPGRTVGDSPSTLYFSVSGQCNHKLARTSHSSRHDTHHHDRNTNKIKDCAFHGYLLTWHCSNEPRQGVGIWKRGLRSRREATATPPVPRTRPRGTRHTSIWSRLLAPWPHGEETCSRSARGRAVL